MVKDSLFDLNFMQVPVKHTNSNYLTKGEQKMFSTLKRLTNKTVEKDTIAASTAHPKALPQDLQRSFSKGIQYNCQYYFFANLCVLLLLDVTLLGSIFSEISH